MLTVPAVAENVAEVDPCGMLTLAGTVAADGEALIATVAPPLPAGELKLMAQVDAAEVAIDKGAHVRLCKTGVWVIVTVPLLTLVAIGAPVESAVRPFES